MLEVGQGRRDQRLEQRIRNTADRKDDERHLVMLRMTTVVSGHERSRRRKSRARSKWRSAELRTTKFVIHRRRSARGSRSRACGSALRQSSKQGDRAEQDLLLLGRE